MGSAEEDRQRPTDEDLSQALNNLSTQERTDLFQKFSAADKKDFATAATQDLANADKKDLATAATQDLSDADKKDLLTAAVLDLPDADRKDLATAATQDLSDADRKDLAAEVLRDLATADRKDLAISAVGTLAPEEQRDVGQMLLPEQAIVNRIWMMVVTTFCAILPLSAAGVFYAAITGSAGTQTTLIVFTSTASLLAGLLAGRGLLASVLERRGA